LFKARTAQEVMQEVDACRSDYRESYVRVVGFDNVKQCQVLSFIVHKPNATGRSRF
jgi:ribulose-bisphosphate carboxylase small chain